MTILLFVVGGIAAVGCSCKGLAFYRASVRAARQLRDEKLQRVERAVTSMLEPNLQYPMCLIRFDDLRAHGALLPHEDVIDRQQLRFLQSHSLAREFAQDHHVAFISHQWLGWRAPDPNGIHHAAICKAMEEVCRSRDLQEEELYVWVDYI